MKKLLILISIAFIAILTSCKDNQEKIKVILPGGTPLVSVGNLLDDDRFSFEVVNGQDPLSAAFLNDEYDIIIAPLNLAAKLYANENTTFKFESIITTNNTYIVSRSPINSINDLNDETIVSFGTNSTPWIVLKASLEKNQINSTLINKSSVSDVSEVIIANSEDAKYYLCDEPTTSILQLSKGINLYTLDLSSELDMTIIFACLFVNPNSNISKATLKVIEDNIKSLNEDPAQYSNEVLNKHPYFKNLGIDVIKQSIPKCNITYLKAKDNLDLVTAYYELLNTYNPNILNGKIPNESFYNQ